MTALTPDDADFRQFATFDRPVQPPMALVDTIHKSMSTRRHEPLIVVEPIASTTIAPAITPVRPAQAPRRLPQSLKVAAAVLVLISLIGSLFVLNRPNGDDTLNNLAFQPTENSGNDVNNAGDAGGSWVVGDVDPEMATAVELGSVTGDQVGLDQTRQRGIIVGDSFIFPTFGTKGFLHRSDLGGTALVWSSPIQALSNIVSDGRYVFLFGTAAIDDPSSRFLAAVSVETGAVMWQTAGLPSSDEQTTSLVISDSVLYVANTTGEARANSTDDGTVQWQVSVGPAGDLDPDMLFRNPAAPFMVLGDDGLFVVRSDQSVARLDPTTGEVTGSLDVAAAVNSSSILTIPQVRGDTLALLVGHLGEIEDNSLASVVPITVLSVDAGALTIEHQAQFADLRGGNMVLTDDAIYVPVADSAGTTAHVARIELASGEVSDPFGEMESNGLTILGEVTSNGIMFLSVSGDTLIIAAGDSRNVNFVDRHTAALVAIVETRYSGGGFTQPIQLWDGQPIAIDGLGGVHLVTDDSDSVPVATPVATPEQVTPGRS